MTTVRDRSHHDLHSGLHISRFAQGNVPFLFVQLPKFMEPDSLPSESNCALMTEAKLQTLSVPGKLQHFPIADADMKFV